MKGVASKHDSSPSSPAQRIEHAHASDASREQLCTYAKGQHIANPKPGRVVQKRNVEYENVSLQVRVCGYAADTSPESWKLLLPYLVSGSMSAVT